MTKRQLMVQLRLLSKGWRGHTFVYEAADANERSLPRQLLTENKIGLGGFGWEGGPFFNTVTIR